MSQTAAVEETEAESNPSPISIVEKESTGSPSSPPIVTEEEQQNHNGTNSDDKESVKSAENGENDGGAEEQHDQDQAIPVSDDEDTYYTEQTNQGIASHLQSLEGSETVNAHAVFQQAGPQELDYITIAQEIKNYMDVNRVNIGEVDTIEEMWGLCDAISAAHSGLPDSLLKEAFNFVLEGISGITGTVWMRKQLDKLHRMWRKEMLKEKSTTRPTKFVSESASYSPSRSSVAEAAQMNEFDGSEGKIEVQKSKEDELTQERNAIGTETTRADQAPPQGESKQRRQRKQAARRKRALASIMGVGQMLDHARRKFATEDGELDVEEDEYGNFTIGGMGLSFENWGQINKIKADDIVHTEAPVPAKRPRGSSGKRLQNGAGAAISAAEAKQLGTNAPQPPSFTDSPSPRATSVPSMAQQYPTGGETQLETPSEKQSKKQKAEKKAAEREKRQEKDEGEISSSSESEEPTSSSEEEDSDVVETKKRSKKMAAKLAVPIRTRDQRKARREEERQQGATSAQNLQVLLRKCFDLRTRIARKLTVQQKAMFMDLLGQSMAGILPQSAQHQHQALAQLMGSFARQTSTS